jgi:hypothetical protein
MLDRQISQQLSSPHQALRIPSTGPWMFRFVSGLANQTMIPQLETSREAWKMVKCGPL